MNLQQYFEAINEQLAPHDKKIMLCVAKLFFNKDLTVQEVVELFLNPEKLETFEQ